MNKKVKALLLVLCALVFAVAGVFATLAYLQDEDEIDNTVTIGNITMTMDEGTYEDIDPVTGVVKYNYEARQSDGNKYHLIPGVVYPKDPIVRLAAQSEPAYVFVQVNNGLAGLEDNDPNVKNIEAQMLANHWEKVDGYTNLWVYSLNNYVVNAKQTAVDLPVFQQFTVDPDANNAPNGDPNIDAFADKHITVKAFAIQTVGFKGDYENALPQLPASWGYNVNP